ncbi:MAG: hypothetical protein ABI609_08320 [Acidobacteriota bacterium]
MSRRAFLCAMACAALGAGHAVADTIDSTASRYNVQPLDRVGAVAGPALDLAAIGREDVARSTRDVPQRFAIPERVSMTPADHGTWEDLGDGQLLWRLRIKGGAGTNSLNLGFTRYKLLPGERLLLYSADGTKGIRPFTAADNHPQGELWTPVLTTADLVVELTIPKANRSAVSLKIGWINQGYRGFGTMTAESYDKSGSCNLDVECLGAGDPWRQQMRSVAVISTGGSTFCSGSLINDTANDHKMYFMTANHCGISSGNAASLVAFWNYQNSFCRTPGSVASGGAGNGVLSQFHTGSFFRAGNAPSDFTLVELDDPPVPAFNHFWAGWDRSTGDFTCTPGSPCAGIHHPNTDEKRITYVISNTATTSYGGTASPGDGTHIWAHWASDPPGPFTVPGVTEPGSSGSPLYSAGRRYIGQLHGGPSSCGATGDGLSDFYGRFSVSWTGGGTNATRLSNWLDPGNTGAAAIDGVEICTPTGPPTIGTASATGPNQIQLTWVDGTPSSTTFDVLRAMGTCAAPGPFVSIAAAVAGSPYTDNGVSGGTTYAYHVAGRDLSGICVSTNSGCVDVAATGSCTLAPTFAGLTSASNQAATTCGIALAWSAGIANCGGPVTYNVYRSTTPGFTPNPGNQIATGITGTAYTDSGTLANNTQYYYLVRSVDGTNSVEETNSIQQGAAPSGGQTLHETFEGGGGFDTVGWTHSAVSGAVDWALSNTQSQTPTHSWFSADQTTVSHRILVSPAFMPLTGMSLSFWHTFAFDGTVAECYDGGTLEYTTNAGGTWTVLPDVAFTVGGFNGTVNNGFSNPIGNKRAWCAGTIGAMTRVAANLSSLAGNTVRLRWHEGDDVTDSATGWFVDSVDVASSCTTAPGLGTSFYTVVPCRLVDTRNAAGPLGGPALAASATRQFTLSGSCAVPSSATALALNLTIVSAGATGSLSAWRADVTQPATSVINFNPGVTRANNLVVAVDVNGAIKTANNSAGSVHVVVDVVGYFQ